MAGHPEPVAFGAAPEGTPSDLRVSLELSSRDLLAELYPDLVAGALPMPKMADLPPVLPPSSTDADDQVAVQRGHSDADCTASEKVRADRRRFSILSDKRSFKTCELGTYNYNSDKAKTNVKEDIRKALRSDPADRQRAIGRLMMSPKTDVFFSCLIAVNALVMIVEEQFKGSIIGHDLRFYDYYGSDAYNRTYMPDAVVVFKILEYAFAVMFTLEAVLRMLGRGRSYWTDPVELFDLFVVFCSVLSLAVQEADSLNIAIFRLMRLAKLLRIVQLIKIIEGFDSLHLMTTALKSSLYALGWAVLLLFTMQTLVALILTTVFRDNYLEDGQVPGAGRLSEEEKLQLFEYFGTYARSMLSTYELTFANWPVICRFLTEKCHEGWMLMVVSYKLTFGFAIIGVLNAVFMQETFKVASTDDAIMVRSKLRQTSVHRQKMEKLFQKADRDQDGRVGLREFRRVLQDRSIQAWLASMDLDASDADLLFELIQKNGEEDSISVEQMIKGIAKLKGFARSIDIQLVLRALKEQWAPEEVVGGKEQDEKVVQQHAFQSEGSARSPGKGDKRGAGAQDAE